VDDPVRHNTIVILKLYAEHDPDQLPRVLWVGLAPSGIIKFVEYHPDGVPDWVARWQSVAGASGPGPIELQITESEYHRWLAWTPPRDPLPLKFDRDDPTTWVPDPDELEFRPGTLDPIDDDDDTARVTTRRMTPAEREQAAELERLADDEAAGLVDPPRYHRARRKD
jgi:hypothetical protein